MWIFSKRVEAFQWKTSDIFLKKNVKSLEIFLNILKISENFKVMEIIKNKGNNAKLMEIIINTKLMEINGIDKNQLEILEITRPGSFFNTGRQKN